MKRNILSKLFIVVLFLFLMPSASLARNIAPIVSTDWLSANLKIPN